MKRQAGYSVITLMAFIMMFAVMSKVLISFHGYITSSSILERFVYFLAKDLSKVPTDKLNNSVDTAFKLIDRVLPQRNFSPATIIVRRLDNSGRELYKKNIGSGNCSLSNKEVMSNYKYLITSVTICTSIKDMVSIPLSVTKSSYHR